MATNPNGLIAQLLSPQAINGFQQGQQDYANNQQQQAANALSLQLGQMRIGAAQQQAQQAHQYNHDIQSYFDNGARVSDLARLAAKYPEQAGALQKSYDLMDSAQKSSRLTQFGNLYNAANNGRTSLLVDQLSQIQRAEQSQGMDTSDIDDALRGLQSGDPDQIAKSTTFVKGIAQIHLAQDPDAAKSIGIGKDTNSTHVLTPGGALVDDAGKVLYRNDDAAPKYQTIKNADGSESIVQLGGGDPSSGTAGAPGGSGQPLSVRLNNPGAIRYNPANQWQGQVGSENGFAKFDTQANGARAHQKLIANQIKAGYDTPLSWAQHYAPASDGNDPHAYAATVAQKLGIGINDKIPLSKVSQVAAASAGVEAGGSPAPNYKAISPASAAKVIFTSQGGGDGDSGGLTPDALDFAANWAIAHGGKTPPGFARNKQAQVSLQNAIAQKAKDAGLSVDDVVAKGQDFITGQQTLNAFAKGAEGKTVRSLNVSVTHLAQLHDAVLALQNGNIPAFNHWAQVWQRNTGSALPTNAEAIKGIVADEVNKAVIGGAGALADRKDLAGNLNIAGSPDQLLGVINQYTQAMSGQLAGLKRQYEGGTGRKDFDKYVSPVAQRALEHENDGSAPVKVSSPQQASSLPSGTLFQTPDGRVIRKR